MTAVAVWGHRPSKDELLAARMISGWEPIPTTMREGERVLGYASCVIAKP